ncbi:hypothetical protein BDR26DRAFT_969614 [Obelidium mucronatum]|nr:hypothetical protein BDR26DRAFT_969614 [Obelidium mucronatum]
MAAIPTQATTWVFETQFSELQQVQLDQLRDIMSLPAGSTAAVIFQAIVDDASNADPVAAWDDRFRLNVPLGPEPQLGHPDRADYNAMAALNTSNAVVPVQPPPPGRFAALRGAFPARPQQQQQRQQQQQPRADRADPEDLNSNAAVDDLSDSDSGQEEDPKGKKPGKKQPQLQQQHHQVYFITALPATKPAHNCHSADNVNAAILLVPSLRRGAAGGRYDLLFANFSANLATGAFQSNQAAGTAIQALLGAASSIGDMEAFNSLTVAARIIDTATVKRLPVEDTQRLFGALAAHPQTTGAAVTASARTSEATPSPPAAAPVATTAALAVNANQAPAAAAPTEPQRGSQELRVDKPCPQCGRLNPRHALYCNQCGSQYPTFPAPSKTHVDEAYIAGRLGTLHAKPPAIPQQAQAELGHLAAFLAARTTKPRVSIHAACPMDIVEFLINKELNGRTQYHAESCPRQGTAKVGSRINENCDPTTCLIRAAPGSIQAAASRLRTALSDLGLTGPWDPREGTGNPADATLIRHHIGQLSSEAVKFGVSSLQAPPISAHTTTAILTILRPRLADETLSPVQKLRWRQFWCFYLLVQTSGRRPGDLVRLRTATTLWLPDRSGILITMVEGKTASSPDPDMFVIRDEAALNALRLYTRDCKQQGILLQNGNPYIFFKLENASDDPRPHATAQRFVDDFQGLLKELGAFQGETLYGFRVGNAIETATAPEADLGQVRGSGGWKTNASALHYSQYAIVANYTNNAPDKVRAVHEWRVNAQRFRYFQNN